tara:strand:- start:6727 stop:8280 length:1554 start_codon:yes stop_codon:yes gene_type:complete
VTNNKQKNKYLALISVSDKDGIVDFAKQLVSLSFEIISTGGTSKELKNSGIPVTDISEKTNFPEIMGGRVKTLHPTIHAGILARQPEDNKILEQLEINKIDLVVVNLYPFMKKVLDPKSSLNEIIENIDIGGPTMIRAAAKNYKSTMVVVNPSQYSNTLSEIKNGRNDIEFRQKLALEAFNHTAKYDGNISNYLNNSFTKDKNYPEEIHLSIKKNNNLKYGENPHQKAAFYTHEKEMLFYKKQIQGDSLSYNNLVDSQAAFECVNSFEQIGCVIVKHANPCGAAISSSNLSAYQLAYNSDAISAFGGIIAFNNPLDSNTAQEIINNQFVEVIIAPEIEKKAIEILNKKKKIRVLETGEPYLSDTHLKSLGGGYLLQEADNSMPLEKINLTISTIREPSKQEKDDLIFGWKIVKYVKSNAIVLVKNQQVIGVGAGQMSRIDSVKLAVKKAKEMGFNCKNCSLASDAFFPFRDGIDLADKYGIKSIIQPGGSIRDQEVVDAANENDISMILTNKRHFRH